MKPITWIALGLLALPFPSPARAAAFQSPARTAPVETNPVSTQGPAAARFPADTFLYLGVDAGALVKGLPQLDLAQLFANPDFRDFFLPLFQRIGADPDDPVGSLMNKLPIGQFLDGQAAIGLRGFRLKIAKADGSETRLEVLPGHPVDARTFFQVMGLVTSLEMAGGVDLDDLQIEMGLDAMLVLDPGPMTVQNVHFVLKHPERLGGMIREVRQEGLAGRNITHILFNPLATQGILTDLYADLEGPRWIVATNAETFQEMAKLAPADSLAAAPDFADLHQRLCPGHPLLFAFSDSAEQLALLENFVPPILTQALDLAGATSYRGSGLAVSLTEGGVHESLGLLLDGRPDGIWTLLDGLPGGIPTARKAPAGTAALLTFKLDPELLFGRFVELTGTLLPGVESQLEPLAAAGMKQAGLDLRADVFEALGDEADLILFAPAMIAAPPDWVLLVKVKNEERAAGLLDKMEAMMGRTGARIEFRPTEIGDGIPARRILLKGVPILPPTLAIHHGWMVCASRPNLITEAVDQWGSDPKATLAGGSEAFQKTLRGLAGGESGNISLLAWLNLREFVPLAFTAAAGMIPPQFADAGYAPGPDEIAPYFSGAAIAVRHDNRAVTLDTFSPFGVLIPSGVAGILASRRFSRRMGGMVPRVAPAGDAAQNLNNQAWAIAKEPGRMKGDYQKALNIARAAVRLEPGNAFYLNTLGVALYRAGEFEEAIETLGKADELNRNSGGGGPLYHPATDFLFLAMAHFQLGHSEQAHEYLERSKELLKDVPDEELAVFLEEASRLIAPL